MNNENEKINWKERFKDICIRNLNTPESLDVFHDLLKNVPEYFYHVPASSSGKYHPASSLGEGGLVRHTLSALDFLCRMIECDEDLQSEEMLYKKEEMKLAIMFHDTFKSGSDEEYTKNNSTKFAHPQYAANMVMMTESAGFLKISKNTVANCILSHMGMWNTCKYDNLVLPRPQTKFEKMVHVADYLASRKEIDIDFNNESSPISKKIPEKFVSSKK